MDDLTRKNTHNEPDLSTDLDGVQREAEQHSDDAQEVIQEAKEQAKREWDGAYDDTDLKPDQEQTRLEGDAHNMKDDLDGDTSDAPDLGQNPDYELQAEAREVTDHMADDVRHEAETLGDSATGLGTDPHGVAGSVRGETGREFGDSHRGHDGTDRDPARGDDHSMVDDIQDAAKGFIDRVKDAFGGDKKS